MQASIPKIPPKKAANREGKLQKTTLFCRCMNQIDFIICDDAYRLTVNGKCKPIKQRHVSSSYFIFEIVLNCHTSYKKC